MAFHRDGSTFFKFSDHHFGGCVGLGHLGPGSAGRLSVLRIGRVFSGADDEARIEGPSSDGQRRISHAARLNAARFEGK